MGCVYAIMFHKKRAIYGRHIHIKFHDEIVRIKVVFQRKNDLFSFIYIHKCV